MNNQDFNRRKFLQTGGLTMATAIISPTTLASITLKKENQKNSIENKTKIRLFSNENPYGPSKKIQEVIKNELLRANRYASYHKYDTNHLIEAIADKNGIETNQVILGHGSFDILRMLARAFGKTKNSLISPELTFNVIGGFADKVFDHKHLKIPLSENLDLDLVATEKAVTKDTQLVYICNPNNPTGKVLNIDKLESFCKRVASKNCVVAIDEAYIDMIEPNERPKTVDLLKHEYNVLIIRTFSKAYGLAGLRVGYAMGLAETIKRINSEHYAFTGLINSLGIAAAMTALKSDTHLTDFRKKNNKVKKYTENALTNLGIEYIPSHTNFIFLNVKDIKRYRIGLKAFDISPVGSGGKKYPNWSRVSIGTQQDMEYYIKALKHSIS